MFSPRSLGFVLNPEAGRKKVDLWEREIRAALRPSGLPFEIVRTTRPTEAMVIAGQLAGKHELVAAVGGDGTVHEVAQGLIGTQCILGLVPNGSGNDFNRYLGMPRSIQAAVRILMHPPVVTSADTAEVIVREYLGAKPVNRWTINTLGIGYDASVAFRRERVPLLKGLPLYLASALWTLADFEPLSFSVQLDSEEPREFPGYMVCLGIGKFEGGGFKVLPDARHDDGIAEICEVKSVSKSVLLPLLVRAVAGAHTGSPHVRMGKAVVATIRSEKDFSVHADGELLTSKGREVVFKLQPRSLRVARSSSVA